MDRRTFLESLLPAAALFVPAGPQPRKYRVGIIGHTGRGNYGHGLDTMWLSIPAAEIAGVADPDDEGRAAALRRLNIPAGFADYRSLLSTLRPDLVAIGPRHVDQHYDMLMTAIAHGARGIYIEKPFLRSAAEADEVIAAADGQGTRIAVAHRNRYHPVLPVIRQLLLDGVIGRVLELRGRGKEDPRGGGLDLWVLGSHVMNLAAYFAGPPRACTATVLKDGVPVTRSQVIDGAEGIGPLAGDEVHARFEMEQGLSFFFDSIRNARIRSAAYDHPASFGLQIIGTAGIIDLRIDQEPLAAILRSSPFDPDYSGTVSWKPISSAGIDQPEPIPDLGRQIAGHVIAGQDLIASIEENRSPLCDAGQGRQTIEMISAVFESHRLGGRRIPFPLATRVNPLTRF